MGFYEDYYKVEDIECQIEELADVQCFEKAKWHIEVDKGVTIKVCDIHREVIKKLLKKWNEKEN